jgi:hypothetical protein
MLCIACVTLKIWIAGVRLLGARILRVKVKINGIFLSCLFQKGTSDTIVFIHGPGSSKEDFLEAFRREEFHPFTMLVADLGDLVTVISPLFSRTL